MTPRPHVKTNKSDFAGHDKGVKRLREKHGSSLSQAVKAAVSGTVGGVPGEFDSRSEYSILSFFTNIISALVS